MTDKEPTKSEQDKLDRLAKEFAETGKYEPGYEYQYVTNGGETRVVAKKIERKG